MIVDYSGDLFTVALLISSPAEHLWLIHSRHVVCTSIKFSLMFKVKIGFAKVLWSNGIGKKCLN